MAIVMVAMLAFGGTYAYFTATAGEARTATTNLGKIALDGTATKLTATSTTNALPGENIFSEDAKLTISDKSNRASYIFIEVSATVTKKGASTSEAFNLEGLDTLDTVTEEGKTVYVITTTEGEGGTAGTDIEITGINGQLPSTWNNEYQEATVTVSFTVKSIQTVGFDDAQDAWDNYPDNNGTAPA